MSSAKPEFKCPVCGRIYRTEYTKSLHIKQIHHHGKEPVQENKE